MWTIAKINGYISEKTEESLYLDYKAADALQNSEGKKNEISKDISSFANSDGGTVIYGIKEFQKDSKFLPEKIDPINRKSFSKETLEQIINSRISPKIHGLIITPVIIDEMNLDEVLYIIEIPKSHTAHQAGDKRYYRRYNFQSIIMDDWEIKDIINRQNRTSAVVRLRPAFNKKFILDFHPKKALPLSFDVVATNIGTKAVTMIDCMIIGTYAVAALIIPSPTFKGDYFELIYTNEVEYKAKIDEDIVTVNVQRMPILPQTFRVLGRIIIYSDFFIDNAGMKITVATEDNRWSDFLKGQDILQSI